MKIVLSIGSNLGNRKENIKNAIQMLMISNIKIIKIAPIYETEPFGNKNQNWFFNTCVLAETQLIPENILLICKTIEFDLGRKKSPHWSERTIDIDILMYDNLILNTEQITLPHKYLHIRKFVLVPLTDIVPELVHPVFNKTITQLLAECSDNSIVNNVKL